MNRDQLWSDFEAQAHSLELDIDITSDGPINAEVVIIGEGPGENEVRTGKPFTGGSGRLLFDQLRTIGLHRANVYTTNVVKRQISLSRKGNERHVVHADELAKWQSLLHWELQQLPNARIILVLGNYALEALTGERAVTNWRGSVIDMKLPNDKLGHVVVTINPAYALRDYKMEPMFMMDIGNKLKPVVNGTFKRYEIEELINPSYKEARAFIRDIQLAGKPFGYDTEVINMETACHGLSNDPHVAMCINLRDGIRNRFTVQEEADILLDLQELFDATDEKGDPLIGIAQNGPFDAYWTRLHDFLAFTPQFDTLLAHHTIYPQLPHNLGFLVSQYTTHPYYKDDGKKWKEGGDIDNFWRYNCKDSALLLAIYKREMRELDKQGLHDFFFNHVMRAQPHLISATVHGVKVDLSIKEKLRERVSEDVAIRLAEFHRLVHELTGDEDYYPNPGSWQQLQRLFFDKLRLVGKGRSTDDTNRTHMIKHPGTSPLAKEMLTALGRWKEENKFLSTYVDSRPSADGRMRCDYKQYGVSNAPGRLSSAGLLDGTGQNLQNQPPRAREMFIADAGTVFCYFDLKQAEAQVVAVRANIPTWKEQYARMRADGSYDAHRALAAEMFKIGYELVPKKDTYIDEDGNERYTIRYTAKRCRHGLNYRMQKERLAEVTDLPFHEAAKAFVLYHKANPELQRWWEQEVANFKKKKELYNALGRRWKVIQRLDDSVMDSVIAFYPQSTIGDKITQVWYQSEEDDEWPDDARVCLDVHDNLVALASPKTAKTALKIMKRYAESPIMITDAWGKTTEPLIIPADLKISTVKRFEKDKTTGKVRPLPDDQYHRWSNMEEVTL